MRLLAVSVLALAFALPAFAAAAGELDPTFGSDGIVLTDFGKSDFLTDVAVQSDGKIVAVGSTQDVASPASEFAVARFNTDGSPDETFGIGGQVRTSFGTASFATAVAIQSDGMIVVAGGAIPDGQLDSDFALARYEADGVLDPTFGTAGRALTDFGSTSEGAASLAIQPDGKLVLAGPTRAFGNGRDFAVARYAANGALDGTFDGDGKIVTDFVAGSDDFAQAAALAPGGKIVVGGYRFNRADFTGNLELARYESDGDLDPTFGVGGKVLNESGGSTGAYDVVVQPDGAVVAAGVLEPELAVFRYTPGGEPDSAFGTAGVATTNFGLPTSAAYAVERQADGRIVVAGQAIPDAVIDVNSPSAFAVARFDDHGRLDETFHGGAVLTEIGVDTYDQALALGIQPNGRIVVGGQTAASASFDDPADFALVGYLPVCKHGEKHGRCKKEKKPKP